MPFWGPGGRHCWLVALSTLSLKDSLDFYMLLSRLLAIRDLLGYQFERGALGGRTKQSLVAEASLRFGPNSAQGAEL